MHYFKCEKCKRELFLMEEYNKETKDVSYGFEWVVEHKSEYCDEEYRTNQ